MPLSGSRISSSLLKGNYKVEVEVSLVEPPEKPDEPESEIDEIGRYVGKKADHRWLWHVVEQFYYFFRTFYLTFFRIFSDRARL